MANAKIIEIKAQHVAEVSSKIAKAQSVILFDYRGLTVGQVTELRNEMRKAGIEYIVLKNSIVERAAKQDGIDERIHDFLKGPTAYAFGYDDAVAPAKILKDTIKKLKKCELKGGIVNGKVFNAEEVNTLADLPSREQLIARLLGSMMSPISGLAVALDQIAKKRSEGAAE
ncbi:MAG: 50S ribosomal protein L10 [Clostridiaceae bacterium]|nr:50S ribosomal protein L10 [Eubacteriales bacterium]